MNGAAELYHPLLLFGHPLAGDGSAKAREAFETIFAGGHRRKIKTQASGFKIMSGGQGRNPHGTSYLVSDRSFKRKDTTVFKHCPDRGVVLFL